MMSLSPARNPPRPVYRLRTGTGYFECPQQRSAEVGVSEHQRDPGEHLNRNLELLDRDKKADTGDAAMPLRDEEMA